MQRTHILAAASLAAFLSLAACNSEPEVISANGVDPQAEALKNAPPVELPPAIQASRTYRCDDNSLLYGVFYTNNTVKVSDKEGAEGTILTAENGQPPYVAEGYSVSADADEISYTAPGKGTQTCHV
jgi:hypothetical protein